MGNKTTTNYGSARWAEYGDLMKMDVLSAHGVVIGLYDGAWQRGLTKMYRWLDTFQNTKVKYAELDYENRMAIRRDKLFDQKMELEAKIKGSYGPARDALKKNMTRSWQNWISRSNISRR